MNDQQYHQEWLKRKARRVLKQSQYASYVKQFIHRASGRTMQVLRAERSRGYASNYERVPTYYLLVYEGNELIHGQTMTQNEWNKQQTEFERICS
jgi:hypothetical protein